MLLPGQTQTHGGGKDTPSSVCALEGRGHILTDRALPWGMTQAQFCCPAHLTWSMSFSYEQEGRNKLSDTRAMGVISCNLCPCPHVRMHRSTDIPVCTWEVYLVPKAEVVLPPVNCPRGFRKIRMLALSHVLWGERGIIKMLRVDSIFCFFSFTIERRKMWSCVKGSGK